MRIWEAPAQIGRNGSPMRRASHLYVYNSFHECHLLRNSAFFWHKVSFPGLKWFFIFRLKIKSLFLTWKWHFMSKKAEFRRKWRASVWALRHLARGQIYLSYFLTYSFMRFSFIIIVLSEKKNTFSTEWKCLQLFVSGRLGRVYFRDGAW